MTFGFSVHRRERAVSPDLVAAFTHLPVANISDCMSRLYAGGPELRPIHTHKFTLGGPALTVRSRPGDNLMLHHAINIASPGDVIVVDAGGETTTAIMGEIMAAVAIKNKVAGIVIYGAIRDAAEIRDMKFPLYAMGVTHRGPYKDGPGEINTPISIGGMVINPGDLILGDGDGVLCVPFEHAEAILKASQEKYEAEQVELAKIADGTADRSWVLQTLKQRGCSFHD